MSVTCCAVPVARLNELYAVYNESFSASEGVAEGRAVSHLAQALMGEEAAGVYGCVAIEKDVVVGATIWSPVTYKTTGAQAWLLSPVATHPAAQGRGVGQQLIGYGLDMLRARNVGVALTYGDPNFYGKLGFKPISQKDVAAPYPLSMPVGWLANELSTGASDVLQGPATCVGPFQNPELW